MFVNLFIIMDLNNSQLLGVVMCEVSVNTEHYQPKKSIQIILNKLLQKQKNNSLGQNRLKRTESKSPLKLLKVRSRNISYVPYRNTPKLGQYSEYTPHHHYAASNQSEFHLPKIEKIKIREMRITPKTLQSLSNLKINVSPHKLLQGLY